MSAAMPMQAAVGAKPYREQVRGVDRGAGPPFTVPAGVWCSFAVMVAFEGQGIYWQFSDGHEVVNNNATQTFTNLETGTSYVHRSDYHLTAMGAADGNIVVVIDGTYFQEFLTGDQSPEGEAGSDGALYGLIGHFTFTYDPKADLITSFEGSGQAIDLCQILSA
jgi:hypothetical protein